MSFDDFLQSKKIDAKQFCHHEPDTYHQWQMEFEQMHPKSFLSQKLYLINPLRRKFKLAEAKADVKMTSSSAMKPKVKPRTGSTAVLPKVKAASKPVISRASRPGKPNSGESSSKENKID